MYLDDFGDFVHFFFTRVKQIWANKTVLGDFSKIQFLAKNLMI